MFRAVLFLGLSIFAASVDAADLKIVAWGDPLNSNTPRAYVKSGMGSPGMPLPQTYTSVDLEPQFQMIPMPGMGFYMMYMGHQGSVSSVTLQSKGWVSGSTVFVNAQQLVIDPVQGLQFVELQCGWGWE